MKTSGALPIILLILVAATDCGYSQAGAFYQGELFKPMKELTNNPTYMSLVAKHNTGLLAYRATQKDHSSVFRLAGQKASLKQPTDYEKSKMSMLNDKMREQSRAVITYRDQIRLMELPYRSKEQEKSVPRPVPKATTKSAQKH